MKSFVILCLTFLVQVILYAQPPLVNDDIKTVPVLVFENFEKSDTRFIRVGGAVKYRLRGDSKAMFKGKLDAVTDHSMTVSGQEIQFVNCAIIMGRIRSDKETVGGILGGMGFVGIGFGSGLMTTSIAAAVPSAVVGAGLFTAGMVMMFSKKRFNLNKGWTVHGGTIEYKLTQN